VTCRERKEKLNNAKKYASHVSKSNLSIEARQVGQAVGAAPPAGQCSVGAIDSSTGHGHTSYPDSQYAVCTK
jgi:hypothetical protein